MTKVSKSAASNATPQDQAGPFAVVRLGTKQFRVASGDLVKVDRLSGAVGDSLVLSEILLVSAGDDNVLVGAPLVNGAKVQATIVSHSRGPKGVHFRMRRRKGFHKTKGFRAELSTLRIENIVAG